MADTRVEESDVVETIDQQEFAEDPLTSQLTENYSRRAEDARNSFLLGIRDVFDRIGYGVTAPQYVNVLFYLAFQRWPWVLFTIGVLNGLKTILSVVWSNLIQEFNKLHRVQRHVISSAGIVFGFSFLLLAFSFLLHNVWVFAIAFLVSTIGVVAYGDLYQHFIRDVIRRERMSWFMRAMARWGVLITTFFLILSGFVLDIFPLQGSPLRIALFGMEFNMQAYGFLFIFMAGTFAFILSGYVTSFIRSPDSDRSYSFRKFLGEYYMILRNKLGVFFSGLDVTLLTLASVLLGLLQIMLTAYAGIAIYKILDSSYTTPFFALGIVYGIAVIAALTGPFFTQVVHRTTGLAPTFVFGTLLMAILPVALVYHLYQPLHIAAITAALCCNVIGGAIIGFGQGLLTKKMFSDAVRHDYFRAQSFIIVIPYLILVPVLSWVANTWPLEVIFAIVAGGLIAIVMPIFFGLVVLSDRARG